MTGPRTWPSEWLEADGLGGFASGTASGERTRRYHALLLSANHPPSDRFVLVNGIAMWLETEGEHCSLIPQRYAPDFLDSGAAELRDFTSQPWPRFELFCSGQRVVWEVLAERARARVLVTVRVEPARPGQTLSIRPLLSGRDFHQLHHENPLAHLAPEQRGDALSFNVYPGVPEIVIRSNGAYEHAPDWYRCFEYLEERARGLDSEEDLATPGVLRFDPARAEALCLLEARSPHDSAENEGDLQTLARELRTRERGRRAAFSSRFERAGESYLVRRGEGLTIIAGYPWFGDWGRDTFIAVRGLCLATGRLAEARDILLAWTQYVSEGMLPNRLPDRSDDVIEYNAVDASLWFVVAASELLSLAASVAGVLNADQVQTLEAAMRAILRGYAKGTRFGIGVAADGLLAAGVPGVQLTWMDAKVGAWVVTPRIGKPVEIQALWLNALTLAERLDPAFAELRARGLRSFETRFWNEARGALYDVVDDNHEPGAVDASLRPNQLFAAGGLPVTLLSPERARRVVDTVERELWTSAGLRTLERSDPRYAAQYTGGVRERDGAYHQGTVWPWLIGPFVEAWVKARGSTPAAKQRARTRFFDELSRTLDPTGTGQIPEIADAEAPHRARGCPFQAWSVAEMLRLERAVL
ncbi:MAG TPA: amylo-alpha-1,6-glucosidase [Polyangiaceae bacterium]|nr:amylo-alpha-1,6-glucosidase [Polyangiaceae bacterium]